MTGGMANRALLIGSPQIHRSRESLLGVANDLDTADEILTARGFDCERLYGPEARRLAILDHLDELAHVSGPADAVVFYFSGHGGQVTNTRVLADLRTSAYSPRYHQFLVPEDFYDHTDAFHGILDIELSYAVARIAERTRNVTVILDCCHSGGMVRAPGGPRVKALDPKYFNRRVTALNRVIKIRLDELRARIDQEGAPHLDADANPDLVRLEATDADHLAIELHIGGRRQGALTHAWAEAMAHRRGQPVSWQALCEDLRARLSIHTGGKQLASIGGPVHRLPFSLEQAPAPGALPVVRRDDALYVRGGSLYGIRPGDRFIIVPAAATRADMDQAMAEVRVVAVAPDMSRVEIVTSVDNATDWLTARAFPVGPQGAWTGLAVQASGPVRAELARCIDAVRSLRLCRLADDPLAVIVEVPGDPGPRVEIHDRVGFVVTAPLAPGPAVVAIAQRLQRAAVLRGQESGRDQHALYTSLELRVLVLAGASPAVVCRHADGRTTWPEAPVEVRAGTEVRCEIVSCAPPHEKPPQKVYLSIFHVDVDGRIVRRSDVGPTGISLLAGEKLPLEYRPHSSDAPVRLDWPRETPCTNPGLRSLIVVASDQRHTLPGFETCDLDAYGATLAPSLLDFVQVPPDSTMTRSRTDGFTAEPAMRYAVLRADFFVVPVDEEDTLKRSGPDASA